jgi:hypothetical protein
VRILDHNSKSRLPVLSIMRLDRRHDWSIPELIWRRS